LAKYTEEETSKYVQTAQWKIHINEAGSGPALFFLHGGGPGATGWSNFEPNLQYLSAKYRCIAVDMPGFGGSDPVAPHQDNWPLALKLLMDAMGIEKAAVCGNSRGGAATLAFAVEYTDRITHIITQGAAPIGGVHFTQPGPSTEGIKALGEMRRDPSIENFRRFINLMVYDPSIVTEQMVKDRMASALLHPESIGPNAPTGPRAGADLAGASILTRLTAVDTPALIIHGRDDRFVMFETSAQAFTALKNARLLVFNRCGHWSQIEHADEFNRQADLFLSTF